MNGATFDKSKILPLSARIGEDGEPVVLKFFTAALEPINITSLDFSLPVRRQPQDKDPVFTLTIGDGLTVGGADSNELTVNISEERSLQRNMTHFWRLFSVDQNKSWLNGPFRFHNGDFDGVTEGYETCGDMDVTIIVSGGASSSVSWVDWDGSSDLIPQASNTTPSGALTPFVFYRNTSNTSTLLGPDGGIIPEGNVLVALVANPGNDMGDTTKWAILSGVS